MKEQNSMNRIGSLLLLTLALILAKGSAFAQTTFYVYTTDIDAGVVSEIRSVDGVETRTFAVATNPEGIALTDNDEFAFVASRGADWTQNAQRITLATPVCERRFGLAGMREPNSWP
ncbi:MAG: hypothetical protein HYR55_18675 [Acidobacteria bacterium]|nr:hypothetical protein [Acidobacteriota bacterium]MBI3655041.1 hypothetical protein [Acidobacteriota bacterium]